MTIINFNLFFLLLTFFPYDASALDKIYQKNYFVVASIFTTSAIGVVVRQGETSDLYYYFVDRKNLNTKNLEENEFKKTFNYNPEKIKSKKILPESTNNNLLTSDGENIRYLYTDCEKITGEEIVDFYRKCKVMTLSYDKKDYIVKGDHFFHEKLADPEKYNNFLIAKIVKKETVSDSSGKIPAAVDGIFVLDLKKGEKVSFEKTNYFRGGFTSLISIDSDKGLLWIGNDWGFYGLDKDLNEIVTCYFTIRDIKKKTHVIKCSSSDFLTFNKWDQALLISKKNRDENESHYRMCIDKVNVKLKGNTNTDKKIKNETDSRYKEILECKKMLE